MLLANCKQKYEYNKSIVDLFKEKITNYDGILDTNDSITFIFKNINDADLGMIKAISDTFQWEMEIEENKREKCYYIVSKSRSYNRVDITNFLVSNQINLYCKGEEIADKDDVYINNKEVKMVLSLKLTEEYNVKIDVILPYFSITEPKPIFYFDNETKEIITYDRFFYKFRTVKDGL